MKPKRKKKPDISFTITGNTVSLSMGHFIKLLTYLKEQGAELESEKPDSRNESPAKSRKGAK